MSSSGEDDEYIEKMTPFLKDIVKEQRAKRGKSKTDKLLERHPSIGESIELLHMFSDDQYFQRNYEEVRHRLKKKMNGYKTQINLLRGQLKRREKSLNDQRATFTKEVLVLREELFRKENFAGYQPQDYRFSEWGDYKHHVKGEGKKGKMRMFGKDELELQSDFEDQRKRFFRQKKDILKDITSKNEKVTQTLGKLRGLEELKLKEVEVLKERDEQVKRIREGLKKKRDSLNEQMKMLQNKMKQIEIERSGKEEQLKITHLKGVIERQESRLDNLKTEIKSARTQHRYFEEKGARKKILNKRAELELEEKERMKKELEMRAEALENSVKEKKKEMVRIATEARITLPDGIIDIPSVVGTDNQDEEVGEVEEEDNELLTEEKKEDFFNELFAKRKKETESEMKEISSEINSFKEEFTSMFQEIEAMQKRMKFYKDDLKKKATLREAKGNKDGISRTDSDILELWKGPEGNMAIVFTDVEGSTQLWDSDCELMQHCMKVHNRLVRKLIRENKGFEVKTEGDAFMIAFAQTTSAIRFALTLQSRLMVTNWPTELYRFECSKIQRSEGGSTIYRGMRVRIGLHVGEPIVEDDDVTERRDYFGPVVITASRLEKFSRFGGHVVISKEAFDEIADIIGNQRKEKKFLGSKVFVKDLGSHKLKGLKAEKGVFVLYPHPIRKRFNLFESTASIPVVEESLDSKLGLLLTKKKDLESRRVGIEKQMVHQVRIKGMEQEVMEKDGLINYLKTKIEHLETHKDTENRMKSGSSLERIKEEMKYDDATKVVREDVDEIMDKYYKMMREYKNLKKNFNNVINMFNSDVKEELGKYEKSINTMKSELRKKIEENMSKEKLWRLKRKEFEINLNQQERIIKKKEEEITKLQKQIDDLISIPTEFQVLFAGGKDEDTKELLSEQDEISKERVRLNEMRNKITKEEEEIRNRKIERMKLEELKIDKQKYERIRKRQEMNAEKRRDELLKAAQKKATEISKKSYQELERIRNMKKEEKSAITKLKTEATREIELIRSRSLTDLAVQSQDFERKMKNQNRENEELRMTRRKLESMERKLRNNRRMMKEEEQLARDIEDRKSEFGDVSSELQDLKSQRNKIRLMLEIENEKLFVSQRSEEDNTPEETIRLQKRLEELENRVLQSDSIVVADPNDEKESVGGDEYVDDDDDNNTDHTSFPRRKTPKIRRRPPIQDQVEVDEKESEEETIRKLQDQQKRMRKIMELQEALHKKEERMEKMIEALKKEKESQESVGTINDKLKKKKDDIKIEKISLERRIDKLATVLSKSRNLQAKLRKERRVLEERVQRFKNKAPPTPPEKEGEEEEEEEGKKTGQPDKKDVKSIVGDDGKPRTPPLSIGSVIYGEDDDDDDDERKRAPTLSEQLVLRNQEVENQKRMRSVEEEIKRLKEDMMGLKEKDNLIEDQIERGEIRKEEILVQTRKKEVEIQELKSLTGALKKKLMKRKLRVESVADLKGLSLFSGNSTNDDDDDETKRIKPRSITSTYHSPTSPSDEDYFEEEEEDVTTDGEENEDDRKKGIKIRKATKKLRMISSSHALTLDEKALEEARDKLRDQEMRLKKRTTDFGKKVEEKMEEKMRTELQTRLEGELRRREEELKRLRQQQTDMKRQNKLMNMSVFLENAINEAVRLKNSFGQQMNWDEDMILPETALEERFEFGDDDLSEVEKMIKEEEERERKNEVDLSFRRDGGGGEDSTTDDDDDDEEEEGEGEGDIGDIEGWQVSPNNEDRRRRRRRKKKKKKKKKNKKEGGDIVSSSEDELIETSEVEIQTSFPSTPITTESIVVPGSSITWSQLNSSLDGQIRDLKDKFQKLSKTAMEDVKDLYINSSSSSKKRYRSRKKYGTRITVPTVNNFENDIEDTRILRKYQREKEKELKRRSKFDHLPSIYEEEQKYLKKISYLVNKKKKEHRKERLRQQEQELNFLHSSMMENDDDRNHHLKKSPHKIMRGYSRVLESADISDLKNSFSSQRRNKNKNKNYISPKMSGGKPKKTIVLPRINQLEESIRINKRNRKIRRKKRGGGYNSSQQPRRVSNTSSSTSSVRRLRKFKKWNSLILDNEFVEEKNAILDELYYSRNAKLYNHVN